MKCQLGKDKYQSVLKCLDTVSFHFVTVEKSLFSLNHNNCQQVSLWSCQEQFFAGLGDRVLLERTCDGTS